MLKYFQHIVKQMRSSGWSVDLHEFRDKTPFGVKTFTNVIATLNPDAPRRMVIACHYDSKIDPPGFLAATDSAVPCAMILPPCSITTDDLSNIYSPRDTRACSS